MFDFHSDRYYNFQLQSQIAGKHIIPFIEKKFPIQPGFLVLEIGSAEGGALKAFTDRNINCTGIEAGRRRMDLAKKFMGNEIREKKIDFIFKSIYDVAENDVTCKFDLIIIKDVIEHLADKQLLFDKLDWLLKKDGKIFISFPPWRMPFGGHQQVCKSKLLSSTPYLHLLPGFLYKGLLNVFKEGDTRVKELMSLKKTGISIGGFERLVIKRGYRITKKQLYLVSPSYEHKFNLKPRKQVKAISALPFFKDFFTSVAYYLIEK